MVVQGSQKEGAQGPGWSCEASCDLALEIPQLDIHQILVVKQIIKVNLDSKRGSRPQLSMRRVAKNLHLSLTPHKSMMDLSSLAWNPPRLLNAFQMKSSTGVEHAVCFCWPGSSNHDSPRLSSLYFNTSTSGISLNHSVFSHLTFFSLYVVWLKAKYLPIST